MALTKEQQTAVSRLADEVEGYLNNDWGNVIQEMDGVNQKQKDWLKENIRWTLLDEVTGKDLLNECAFDGNTKRLPDKRCAACGQTRREAEKAAKGNGYKRSVRRLLAISASD